MGEDRTQRSGWAELCIPQREVVPPFCLQGRNSHCSLSVWDAQSKHREGTAEGESRGLGLGIHLFWVCREFCGVSQGTHMAREGATHPREPHQGTFDGTQPWDLHHLRKPNGKCSCNPARSEKHSGKHPQMGTHQGALQGTGQGPSCGQLLLICILEKGPSCQPSS